MVGILTETALVALRDASEYDRGKAAEEVPRRHRRHRIRRRRPIPSPWRGGWWRLRDAVDYIISASLATLDIGSQQPIRWLYGMYQMGSAAIDAGTPPDRSPTSSARSQRDPGAARRSSTCFARRCRSAARRAILPRGRHRTTRLVRTWCPWRSRFAPTPRICSSRRSIPTAASRRTARRSRPTTSPAGRCRRRWVSTERWCTKAFAAVARSAHFHDSNRGTGARRRQLHRRRRGAQRFVRAREPRLKAGGSVPRTTASARWASASSLPGAFVFDVGPTALSSTLSPVTTASACGNGRPPGSTTPLAHRGSASQAVDGVDGRRLDTLRPRAARVRLTPHVLDADIRAGRLAERFDVIVLADSPASQLLNGYSAGNRAA